MHSFMILHRLSFRFFQAILVIIVLIVGNIACAHSMPRGILFFTEFDGKLLFLNYETGIVDPIHIDSLGMNGIDYCRSKRILVLEGVKRHDQCNPLYLYHFDTKKIELIHACSSYKQALYRPKFDLNDKYLYALNYSTGIFRYSMASRIWEKMNLSGIGPINPQQLSISADRKICLSSGDYKGFYVGKIDNLDIHLDQRMLTEFSILSIQWVDENTIIFAGKKEPGLQYLWKYELETGHLIQLTIPPLGVRDFLSISQDLRSIVFTATDQEDGWALWEISTDGTDLRKLTQGYRDTTPLSPVWVE